MLLTGKQEQIENRKIFSKEFKARAALDAIKGQKTINELSTEYGVIHILWLLISYGMLADYNCHHHSQFSKQYASADAENP